MNDESQNWMEVARNYLEYQVNLGFREVLLPRVQEDRVLPDATLYDGTLLPHIQQNSVGLSPLESVKEELGECTRCPLHRSRRSIVFGEGNPNAGLMFIGEGPGADEDRQGRPFVGRAGQLLTRMIQAMRLDRDEVYIANTVKCRPPENRDPEPVEIRTCFPFLEGQIAAIAPKVIVALGRVATCTLLDTKESISNLRGEFRYRNGIPIMPTYHPSFLLRAEPDKRPKAEAWADLQKVMALLESPEQGSGDK
jgi:uracil-DNA glycosylase